MAPSKETKPGTFDIELVDEAGQPMAGHSFRLYSLDNELLHEGTLDDSGCASVEGIDAEECQIEVLGVEELSLFGGS